jgi:type IV pilus assembly protein PilE
MGETWDGQEQQGVTLLELLIAVAVLAVLASIAVPSYSSYVTRGKIATALGELSAARVRLEQFYQDNRNYGSTATGCGVPMPSVSGFTMTCTWGDGGTSQSFIVTAAGAASAGMSGYTYSIDNADRQNTVQFDGVTLNAPCWIKKRGETC